MSVDSNPVIRVDGVSRWFGSVVAVSDVTFDITPGITGLLGPNGAGKTTLLRMMTGLAATSRGTVTVFGEPVRDNPPLYKRIGVMSEHETVYGFMKGREFVRMMGELRGVNDLERAVDRRSRSSISPTRSIGRWTRTRAACGSACVSPRRSCTILRS